MIRKFTPLRSQISDVFQPLYCMRSLMKMASPIAHKAHVWIQARIHFNYTSLVETKVTTAQTNASNSE
eukprot:g33200.t1